MEVITDEQQGRERWYGALLEQVIPRGRGYLIRAEGNPVAVEDVTIYSEPGCDVVVRPWRRGGIPLPVIRVVKTWLVSGRRRLIACDCRGQHYRIQSNNPAWRGRNGGRLGGEKEGFSEPRRPRRDKK